MADNARVFFDGVIMPADTLRISPVNRGVSYGDGLFETLSCIDNKIFALDAHIKRLEAGCEHLGLQPRISLDLITIQNGIQALCNSAMLQDRDKRIRIQVWRKGPGGYQTKGLAEAHVLITAQPLSVIQPTCTLFTATTRRVPGTSIPSFMKHSNGLNYILAQREADDNGCDEALMLDTKGKVSETTIANIFWNQGKTIFTPPEECDPLPGITRKTLLAFLRDHKFDVREMAVPRAALDSAESVWLTNSVRGWRWVTALDHRPLNEPESWLEDLRREFTAYLNQNALSIV